MSKLPRPGSSKEPPKSGGIPRPSTSFRPTASSTMYKQPCAAKEPKPSVAAKLPPVKLKRKPAKEMDYLLPALSVFKPKPADTRELEKMRKAMIRRNAPQGEDLKKIKEILKGMKGEEITVHEFVGLVAPYTGDNGTALRTILASDLSNFRQMARNIYDTMTKDVSDVLANEHVQLTEASRERHGQYSDKMMRAIDKIYEYAPNFDFEKYYTDPNYLEAIFPLATEPQISEDERAGHERQQCYHRMIWLRAEGERLGQENRRLQSRLRELKSRQRQETSRATDMEREYERKREQLEKTQDHLEDQLEKMNNTLERSMVEEEKSMREALPAPLPEKKRVTKRPPKLQVRRPENWNVKAAAEIEERSTSERMIAESSRVSMASDKGVSKITEAKRKKKRAVKKPPSVPQEASPFHYSPIKTPPCPPCQKPPSPFHYSPPKTPPEFRRRQAPRSTAPAAARSPPRLETTRVQSSTTVIEDAPATNLPRGRRSMAPRDTWSGFR